VGSGSGERAVVASVRAPEISGVGIVCAGADDPKVAEELCELVSAALGIGSNRIYVTDGS
jgi:stage III sporulation protein AG